jgi:hypothetical protein
VGESGHATSHGGSDSQTGDAYALAGEIRKGLDRMNST